MIKPDERVRDSATVVVRRTFMSSETATFSAATAAFLPGRSLPLSCAAVVSSSALESPFCVWA